MIRFLGSIVSGIVSRILVMGLMFGGGTYFVQSQGGIQGVASLVTERMASAGEGGATPSIAGIGGLAALLPGATPQQPEYFVQQARISEITMTCRLTVQENGRLSRTQPLDCARARAALHDPKFAGYTMQKKLMATYIYYAMDGIDVREGQAALTGWDRTRRVGDVIDIRVNSRDPRQSTPI